MKSIFSISLLLIVLACSKYEIESIDNNKPPEELVVTESMKENYINRVYITLLGRKPLNAEFADALNILGEEAIQDNRELFVNGLYGMKQYHQRIYAIARADYLESVDTVTIATDYQQALNFINMTSGPQRDYWIEIAAELKALIQIPNKLDSGLIDVIEVHRRIVDNTYYDNINMGTENFVVATFQNFIFRYPTEVELQAASTMVNGFPSSVFLQPGNSKEDFISIFFSSDDYFEGEVISLYNKYLFREPISDEMVLYANKYALDHDYQKLQTSILASDEYFFF